MLVDINLLPQKEKKKSWRLLTVIICLAVLAALLAAGWFFYQSQMQKVEQLNRELTANEELRQVYESTQNKQTTPTDELETAIQWAQANRKETSLLLENLTALLPERGFIQQFSYGTAGKVTLVVQFDTARQAADFLHLLQTSSYIKSIELGSISTNELEGAVDNKQTELPRYQANYELEIDLQALLTEEDAKQKEVSP